MFHTYAGETDDDLFKTQAAAGTCQVMCFHPHSDVTLPVMTSAEVIAVIDRWAEINKDLGAKYAWVQVRLFSVFCCDVPYFITHFLLNVVLMVY